MSTISDSGFPTIANVAAALDPNGNVAKVANVLDKVMPEIGDIPWMEGNLTTGHRITRTANSLPTGSWRQLNQGVAASKAETAQFDETCGIIADESKIDVGMVALHRDGPAYRSMVDKLKVEGLTQKFGTALWYESVSSNPERIHGLTARYPATTGYTNSSYVLAGTNAGVNAQSIWLVTWELGKIYGIYPQNTQGGLKVQDKGEQRVTDATGAFYALCTWLEWHCGIAVEDYRYAVRYQYDPDDAAMANTEKGLYLGVMEMVTTLHRKTANTRFYMSRDTFLRFNQQLLANEGRAATFVQLGGEMVPQFLGIPIRITDNLVAETAIS
jgi:hypothetical protein